MEELAHWTQRSVADFVYNISSNFVSQLERRMEEREIGRGEFAVLMNKSKGRVSQVFNNPGNLSLRVIVEYARTLGMKVSLVAYDDGDPEDKNGPINPEVFVKSWEMADRPQDLFEVAEKETKQAEMTRLRNNISYGKPQSVYASKSAEPQPGMPWIGNLFGESMDTTLYSITGCASFSSIAQTPEIQNPLLMQILPTTQELRS
jgi:hypothetical protein